MSEVFTIKDVLIKIVEELNIFIDEEETLHDVDSLSYIQFVIAMEDIFNIEFPDELLSITSLTKINDFVIVVQNLIENKSEETNSTPKEEIYHEDSKTTVHG